MWKPQWSIVLEMLILLALTACSPSLPTPQLTPTPLPAVGPLASGISRARVRINPSSTQVTEYMCDTQHAVWVDHTKAAGFDQTLIKQFSATTGQTETVQLLIALATQDLKADTRLEVTQVDYFRVLTTDKPIDGCTEFVFGADSWQNQNGPVSIKFIILAVEPGQAFKWIENAKRGANWIEVLEHKEVEVQ